MPISLRVARAVSLGLLVLGAGAASAQTYPNKVVRIVTSEVGGGNDIISRILAQEMSGLLGQQVIVENRPTIVSAEVVAKAPPDGYTVLLTGALVYLGPLLRKLSFDPVKDFAPISIVDVSPNVLVVHPSLPAKSVKELITLAKAKPGALNYASSGSGGSLQLGAELFKLMADVDIVRIDYKGTGPALTSMISGETQIAFTPSTSVAQYTKSGRLRGLAVTSLKPSVLVPGLPPVAASGLPGFELVLYHLLLAPSGTPAVIITRLNQELARALSRGDVKEKFLNLGTEAAPSSPEEAGARMKFEIAQWDKVIKKAGIKPD